MEKRKRKWWLAILIGGLAASVCSAGIFAYVRPKMVLSSALPRLFSQLEERFQGDPLLMAADFFDREGKYTADVVLRVDREITGPVTFDMTAQTDFSDHCFFADGTISSSEKSVNASLYLDDSFAAVSSEELVQGEYYGITYDSFSSDIRSLPLLSPFVSEQVLDRWTDSVQRIQRTMSLEYPEITVPSLSQQNLKTLLLGIAALPCSRETVSAPINGETLSCLKFDYSFDGQQLENILGESYPEDTAVSASFYLFDTSIVRFLIQYQQGCESYFYSVTFGKDPLSDPLTLQGNIRLAETLQTFSLRIDTVRKGNRLEQTLRYENAPSSPLEYAYEWESANGTMYIKTDAISTPAKLRLSRESSGLQVETADLGKLIRVFMRESELGAVFDGAKCTMAIQTGTSITAPAYKNLDIWSFDDFLILMGGLGSLIGFPFDA